MLSEIVTRCSLPVCLVARRDVEDPVGVDVERDLDLRHAARRRLDALQPEARELAVVGGQLALALQHDDVDRGLVVLGGGERLRAPGRDRRVALDHLRHHAAERLEPERQRGDVEQHDVLDLALEHARLKRGADRDHLVGVDGHVRLLAAGQTAHQLLHGRDPGGAADQDHLVDVVRGQLGVRQRLLDRPARALHQVLGQLLELRARERQCSGAWGPTASAVTNGRLICVWVVVESSTLARSAAS